MRATAFCPGHITGFFLPCEHEDLLRSGSRGAGLCVDRGATSTITVKGGDGRISVRINGELMEAPVTRTAVSLILEGRKMDVTVDTCLDLPLSAGFGMSAAGALSASIAMAEILDLSREEAFAAAHIAELSNHTGLGDVAALTRGGVTFRRKEGLPPFGRIDRLATELDIIAGVIGGEMHTSDVLRDPVGRERLMRAGRECYENMLKDPSVNGLFRLSRRFTMNSGIATPRVLEVLEAIDGLGDASMIMLGNSVFARGKLDEIEAVLSRYGPTFRLSLDNQGPRVLATED